jgi:hypothetical protein
LKHNKNGSIKTANFVRNSKNSHISTLINGGDEPPPLFLKDDEDNEEESTKYKIGSLKSNKGFNLKLNHKSTSNDPFDNTNIEESDNLDTSFIKASGALGGMTKNQF